MRFLSSNLEIYKRNTSAYNTVKTAQTGNKTHSENCTNQQEDSQWKLHKPATRLTMYQSTVYCKNINIYNKIPHGSAEIVSNKKCFLQQLKNLTTKLFYSVEEYMDAQQTEDGRHSVEMFT
jgi:hypothetical protein